MNGKAIHVAIAGAAGRMGQRLCALALGTDGLKLAQAIDVRDVGKPAAEGCDVRITDRFAAGTDVLVDFTTPAATRANLAACVQHKTAMVIGTTGLTAEDERSIDAAAKSIAIVAAANFSRVVNVMTKLAAEAAQLLGPEYDAEIAEVHHRFKKDAPSGTALSLARVICDATGRSFDKDVRYDRHGHDAPRQPGEITVQALRVGDVVGEHTVYFGTLGERMELRHVAASRDSYASGALQAARWVMGRRPGRYGMADVLGLK